ncbi:hypothetical protein NDU88_006071 [Pleurodeles waltl]|uniref:Uncharacterized protein n=1 Tax=Pleurodeles waltl TaxID=8319 RepID=A0AAV7W9K2_PLEWA|nr:hypothetical protein NDU88_006071 [Pleurodeles waltl]
MSDLNVEKEGSQEEFIRRIVYEEVKAVVQESMRQALGNRKGMDEEKFYSVSEDEDRLRGLELEYKDDLEDDFGTVFRANSDEELLDPLGGKLFEPKDIRHPRDK